MPFSQGLFKDSGGITIRSRFDGSSATAPEPFFVMKLLESLAQVLEQRGRFAV